MMEVTLPNKLDKSAVVSACDMDGGKVYRFQNLLVSVTPCDGIIAVDTDDHDIMTFNNHSDFIEFLNDQDIPDAGEVTPFTMRVVIE